MRHFEVVDLGEDGKPIVTVYSENDILDFYWEHWSSNMRKIGKEDCISDWIAINWAEEVDNSEGGS